MSKLGSCAGVKPRIAWFDPTGRHQFQKGSTMIKMKLKLKYTQGGFEAGNHGKVGGNGMKKNPHKRKHAQLPIIRGSRAQSFS